MAAMGFGGFGTTKVSISTRVLSRAVSSVRSFTCDANSHLLLWLDSQNHKVEGNATGSANVKKERTWRQYMNR
ncbi:hypothetical protein BCV69DRAFT_280590 [Microstroma glucosiphilum]|uniref:U4/U6.U5 small nuclear ribonucleoprotein 27kDa protein domain-containing protein n=1 Tax=Pseudomicrostroma glucosiphilum TaxID=1684307 RepID=A0A316UCL3_9BASI|nr:hypothetical protein BCV69DRAFT_280590 [Pseudomicrostroma glucosiphilum]PWN22977.1 hypothetical protein BCV69DRAFT_280590 [Pseudomicrostroma glucosiphilum]